MAVLIVVFQKRNFSLKNFDKVLLGGLGCNRVSGKKTLFLHLAHEVPGASNNEFIIVVVIKYITIAKM